MKNSDIGVITEQGFVAGNNLGFNPIKENDLNPLKKDKDDSNKEENNK